MPGYRTIPSKDTFDVDERLGGIVTLKQLAYPILGFLITYGSYLVADSLLEGSSDSIFIWGTVLFGCLLFTFANVDKWIARRINYYFGSRHQKLEKNPNLLANIRSEEEDKIITLDGRVIAVLKVTPINFPLLSEEAKEGKIGAYETYLRQLVHPIMHLVQSEEVDIGQYLSNVARDVQYAKKKGIRGMDEYEQDHARFLHSYLKRNKSRTKSHYVVLQVQDPRYRNVAKNPSSAPFDRLMLRLSCFINEFSPEGIFSAQIFAKPRNYVKIDTAGKRMIFKSSHLEPKEAPARSKKIGQILQFESLVALLRYARSKKKEYYYGDIDLELLLKEEFRGLSLAKREEEFSIEER
ncbi:MAG: hypothetical protein V1822_00150, partial [Candidatus Micrarchaeota archaeon]